MAKDKKIRILVGTRKGSFIVEGDTRRRTWKVGSRAQEMNEVYHVAADPRHPGQLYAAANNTFWGPELHKSTNWGKSWKEITTPMSPPRKERKWEGSDEPSKAVPLKNLWHIEPGHPSEPNTVFLGADPHFLFRSDDLGKTWEPNRAINEHPGRNNWSPGAGGACLHTIIVDPRDADRMYLGLSAVGTFRTDDGGHSWRAVNKNVQCPFLPKGQQYPETGQCVHHVAIDPANPETFYRQDHGGMYVSHDGMESWKRIGKPLGDDFGFCVASPKAAPGRAYFVRLDGGSRTTEGHFQVHEWNDKTNKWRKLVKPTAFPGYFGVQREGIATDTLDPPGIYVGTTTGQLFVSPDAGKSWQLVPFAFPGIHAVSVASPGAE